MLNSTMKLFIPSRIINFVTILRATAYNSIGWRHGSVVRTSVFGWQTFPDLCLMYGWHVTTLWVKCLLWVNQPGQLSLPSTWGQ